MAATLFQACQQGKLAAVTEILEENKPELEAKDAHGMTALMYAAQAGHVAIVQELLSRGATPDEAASHNFAKDNAEIASMLSSAVHNSVAAASSPSDAVPQASYDSYGGGQPMADGSVSYVQQNGIHPAHAAGDAAAMAPHQLHHQQPYPYHPQQHHQHQHQHQHQHPHQHHHLHHPNSQPPPPSFFDPTQMSDPPRGHAHKDSSSANLPPPDVARLIPCKFFPNCRYGDKCLFAHPIPLPSTSGAGPVSPGQAPVFYPSNYAYAPYGPPHHFYSVAPPMPMQYPHAGVPLPPHMSMPPHMAGPHVSDHAHLAQADGSFNPAYASQHAPYYQPAPGVVEATGPAAAVEADQAGSSTEPSEAAPPAESSQDAAKSVVPSDASSSTPAAADALVNGGDAEAKDAATQPQQPATAAGDNAPAAGSTKPPVHRRQSFNSFLHHHAIPFQPSQAQQQQLNGDAALLQNVGQPPFARGAKGPRRGGASLGGSFGRSEFGGSNKRADRPACYFFIRGVCKHGEDCRFPHILPDGTDARGPSNGRSGGASGDAHRSSNRGPAAKGARNGPNGNATASAAGAAASATTAANGAPTQSSSVKKGANGAGAASVDQGSSATTTGAGANAAASHAASTNGAPAAAPATKASSTKTDSAPADSKPAQSSSDATTAPTGADKGPAAAASNSAKPATSANGVNGANAHKAGGMSNHNARPANGRSSNGRGNGQQQQGGNQGANGHHHRNKPNGAAAAAAAQRVPNSDDFPALPNAPGPTSALAATAPASTTGTVSGGAAAQPAPHKANFSAILSAPAPVRKTPEVPVADATAVAVAAAAEVNDKDVGETSTSTSTSTPQQPPANDEVSVDAAASSLSN